MEFDFEQTQRTVWKVENRTDFFDQMRELLNIDDFDAEEIREELTSPDFDYLEVASYLPGAKQEDPDAVLVFEGKKNVYWDIFNAEKASQFIQTVQSLVDKSTQMTETKKLTQNDWRKRFEALGGF
jgi:hypothetical protein